LQLWRQLATVAARAGRPVIALLPRFARLYFRDRYAPGEILRLELLERRQSALGEYISKERMLGVQARLNPRAHAPVTEDKLRFQAFCSAAGLPIPRGLAELTLQTEKENAAAVASLAALSPGPLFVKPARGFRGKDVQSLDRVPGGFRLADGTDSTPEQLLAEPAANPRFRTWMVQERLVNHAQVLAVSPTAAVPLWEEASALACRAAAWLLPTRTLGWEIALTPAGPVIIEANRKWAPQNLDGLMGTRLRRMAELAAVLRG